MILRVFLLICFSTLQLSAQQVASYYFENSLAEFKKAFIDLEPEVIKGTFQKEVVRQFGSTPRPVYVFPTMAGLKFDNSKLKDFIKDSYAIEMFFRYDNGSLLLYNQLLGDKLNSSQGKYVHLVMTRNAQTKQVIVYLNGKLQMSFYDYDGALEMAQDREIIFFSQEGVETTSGAVAMIKIYNYFIDEKTSEEAFESFREPEPSLTPTDESATTALKRGDKLILKKLYFTRSEAVLLPESLPQLEALKNELLKYPNMKIELQGHTDNQGDFKLNTKLSIDRAEAVKAYMVAAGIDGKRISTRGFGSTRPVASNAAEDTRKLNRRVELIVL